MTAQLYGVVAAVAARHAFASHTCLRVDLCYADGATCTGAYARIVFMDDSGKYLDIDLDVELGGSPADLESYRGLVELEIAKLRGLIEYRKPSTEGATEP